MEYWHVRGCCAGPRFRWSRRSLDSGAGGGQCRPFVGIEAGINQAFCAKLTMRRLQPGLDRGLAVSLMFEIGISFALGYITLPENPQTGHGIISQHQSPPSRTTANDMPP